MMTNLGRLARLVAIATLSIFAVLPAVSAPGATAQEASPVPGTAGCAVTLGIGVADDSCLTVVHVSPGAPEVDIWVDGIQVEAGLAFGDATRTFALPAGEHRIQVAPTGSSRDAALIDATADLTAGEAWEVAATGRPDALTPLVTTVDLSPLPPSQTVPVDYARIRVIHAVPDAGPVNAALIGGDIAQPVARGLAFGEAGDPADFLGGRYQFLLTLAEDGAIVAQVPNFRLEEDTVVSLYATGDPANGIDPVLVPVAYTLPAAAVPAAVGEGFTAGIQRGTCADATGQVAYALEPVHAHDASAAPIDLPDGDFVGAPTASAVYTGRLSVGSVKLDDLLASGTWSILVTDTASGDAVACGDMGGVSSGGWWHDDRLTFGLSPVAGSNLAGVASVSQEHLWLEPVVVVGVVLFEVVP